MPRFTTTIPTHGSAGNIHAILTTARSLMRQLNVPRADIEALTRTVLAAPSYAAACAAVRKWFPLEDD